jgi:hypothetical protein
MVLKRILSLRQLLRGEEYFTQEEARFEDFQGNKC